LRIRRAVLEATLRSHNDFNTAFSDFEEWLKKIATRVAELETLTQNTQALKDTAKRHEWIQQHKDLENELNAHESVLTAVDAMGQKLCTGQESGKERSDVQNRLNAVCQKWKDVRSSEQLIGLAFHEMLSQQPVGGCLSAAMAQSAWLKSTEKEMEVKGPQINEAITNAHSFLMQHDLRPKIHRTSVLAEDDDADKLDVVQRRCGLKIHADCEKLKEKWAELGTQLTDWDQAVHAAALRLQELERALAECQLHLSAVESEVEHLRPVERLRLEELKDARRVCESLAIRVGDLRIHVDDANDACGRVLAADAPLDQHPRNQLDVVNERFLALKTALRVRSAALRNALADFGPSSEHFLNQSVALPWQRAISKTNQLPYYIDHTTEKTQWEHPVWVEMTKELSQFNRVKFIAYRTAMKLRALQKRLCLDLIDIPMLEKCFSRLVGLSNEESPGLESMVSSILPLFEQLNAKYPQMVRSVALAVDLCINFLLNLFDPSRDGLLRVLSFKIALIVLSSAPLEEKYRFLFNLVAQDGQADQKHIALLLYDLIQIPRLVGEAAAFGGSNVEPSVRSCFEMVRLAPTISLTPFLEWMKQEPQSVVWLPVMHRLATAEFAKHQAKCNVCKMFPIVGLRYRCLRCFNLDLCQNCFFSQRTAKKHKLKHPMQEYAVPTTSAEDARDFARMVRNKFSRSKNSLGYLPVDVTDEGRPLAAPPPAAQNPATEALHQRSATLANRLALLTASLPAESRDERIADIQSPAQIINQVEQMQKDELDQVLQRLQLENLELKRELERRKLAVSSTPDLDKVDLFAFFVHFI
uniref:WW domain-containing protein n=1 Tax=Angiostrongylus cantonensis TaxID=6313 RepID=A0A158P705_ANGCA